MQEAIELGKLQEAATRCTNDAWPAQISKLQTLLEEQEAKINRVMNKAEEKIFAVLGEKEINAVKSNTYLDSYPARFEHKNQEKQNNTESYKQEPKQEQDSHRTPYAKDLEKEVAELRRQLTRNRRLNDPNAQYDKTQIKCWNCQTYGHMQRECTRPNRNPYQGYSRGARERGGHQNS